LVRNECSGLAYLPDLHKIGSRWTARDLVADKIGRLIVSGILQVGDQLPNERDLAGALQVSRETVRDGIQNLAVIGIIEVS
jgi:DNA-binding FadR family transcriptional regulator